MPQHLLYNAKIGLMAILVVGLAAEHFVNYEPLFKVSVASPQQPVLKSMGIIDQYIKQYNYTKYQHVVDDNIFSEKVVVMQKPVEKATINVKPFTVQLEIKGIAITPERKLVMIWDKQRKETQILLEDEELYQWKVVSIEKHIVILEHESGELYEFLINDETLTNFNEQR